MHFQVVSWITSGHDLHNLKLMQGCIQLVKLYIVASYRVFRSIPDMEQLPNEMVVTTIDSIML